MNLYSFIIVDCTFSLKTDGEIEAFSFEEANEELQKAYRNYFRNNHSICILKEIPLSHPEILEYEYLDFIGC